MIFIPKFVSEFNPAFRLMSKVRQFLRHKSVKSGGSSLVAKLGCL